MAIGQEALGAMTVVGKKVGCLTVCLSRAWMVEDGGSRWEEEEEDRNHSANTRSFSRRGWSVGQRTGEEHIPPLLSSRGIEKGSQHSSGPPIFALAKRRRGHILTHFFLILSKPKLRTQDPSGGC